jgi:hypothetical protein
MAPCRRAAAPLVRRKSGAGARVDVEAEVLSLDRLSRPRDTFERSVGPVCSGRGALLVESMQSCEVLRLSWLSRCWISLALAPCSAKRVAMVWRSAPTPARPSFQGASNMYRKERDRLRGYAVEWNSPDRTCQSISSPG